MKSVRPERLNTQYACPQCGGFLAVYGSERNDEWRCTGCDTFYTRELLREDGLRLYVHNEDLDELIILEEYIAKMKWYMEREGGCKR